MKLIRHGPAGEEKPGLITPSGERLDVSGLVPDYDSGFFSNKGLETLRKTIDPTDLPRLAPDTRLGSPVARPGKIICIGLNYRDHARESGMELPQEPVIFMKAASALAGPHDDLPMPPGATKLDWEVELAVVISKRACRVSEESAMDHVAGFMCLNDYSERAWQLESTGQWVKGKSADGFAPAGPWLVTPDEIKDPGNLRLWLSVNGTSRQDGSTRDLIFPIPHLISYVSRFMSLLPGDILSTGTPSGVGIGLSPPMFLKPGDEVRLGVEGLGEQHQRITG